MARFEKGIRSRDARRVSFASLTTPLFARQSRDDLLGWRLVALAGARVLIAFGSLSPVAARPPSLTYGAPFGVPWSAAAECPERCSTLARLRPVPGRLLARSQPRVPLRPVGLVRAPGALCCHGGAAISRRPLGCCGCGGHAAVCCIPASLARRVGRPSQSVTDDRMQRWSDTWSIGLPSAGLHGRSARSARLDARPVVDAAAKGRVAPQSLKPHPCDTSTPTCPVMTSPLPSAPEMDGRTGSGCPRWPAPGHSRITGNRRRLRRSRRPHPEGAAGARVSTHPRIPSFLFHGCIRPIRQSVGILLGTHLRPRCIQVLRPLGISAALTSGPSP
ncbi:hypothetical protein ABIE52_006874 [Rhodococcus sp. OAS809]